uniref:Uncharacterized protein n=1 Tax=Euplotes harpa TaxID=151035 RepID=A0A7S3N951_9SPIT|mmetsp:Transcript_25636/g.29455  ORF Transcript_25636/g.29455 Transcript_25636/m.29455 type:complete len:160 (+) Transcript_25636:570-1049(+)
MRKYYADLLQDNTQYKRKIRNVKLKHQMLLTSSAELSESIQGTTGYKSLPFFLASLAFPCDMRKHLTSIAKARKITPDVTAEGTDVLDIIESTLNRFSKKILKRFMTKPELCSLLLHYLGKVHNNEYAQYYQMLDEMARSSISLRKGEESIVVQILSNA